MNLHDYYQQAERWWLRLHEKGGKHQEIPVHDEAEEYFDAYLKTGGIADQKGTPSRRNMTKGHDGSVAAWLAGIVFQMIQRSLQKGGTLQGVANCHPFRATGTTGGLNR